MSPCEMRGKMNRIRENLRFWRPRRNEKLWSLPRVCVSHPHALYLLSSLLTKAHDYLSAFMHPLP
jgi:hypothetical protein